LAAVSAAGLFLTPGITHAPSTYLPILVSSLTGFGGSTVLGPHHPVELQDGSSFLALVAFCLI